MPPEPAYSLPAATHKGQSAALEAVRAGRSFEVVNLTLKHLHFAPWITEGMRQPGAFDHQAAGELLRLVKARLPALAWEVDFVFNKDPLWDIWAVLRAPVGSGLPVYSVERSVDGTWRVFMRDFVEAGRFITETVPLDDDGHAASLEGGVELIWEDTTVRLARCGLQPIPDRAMAGRMTSSRLPT